MVEPTEPAEDGATSVEDASAATIRSGIAWFGIAALVTRLADLVALVAVLAILTPAQLGIATAVRAFQSVVESFAGTGLGASVALVQAPTLSRGTLNGMFWYATSVGAVSTVAFVFCAWPLATWLDEPEIVPLMFVAAPRFLFMGTAIIPLTKINRDMRFRASAAVNMAGSAIGAISRTAFVIAGLGAWSIVAAHTLQAFSYVVLGLLTAGFIPRFDIAWQETKRVIRYGWSVLGAVVGAVLQQNVDYLLVGRLLDMHTLGIYRAAYDVSSEPISPIAALGVHSAGPVMARLVDDKAAFSKAFGSVLRTVMLFATLVAVTMFCVSDEVMMWMKDGQYAPGILCARILIVASLGRVFFVLYQVLFEWTGAGRAGSLLSLLSVACLVGSILLCVEFGLESFGIAAVGIGWLVALPIPILVGWQMQKKRHGLELSVVSDALKPAFYSTLVALPMGLAAEYLSAGLLPTNPVRVVFQAAAVILGFGLVMKFKFGMKLSVKAIKDTLTVSKPVAAKAAAEPPVP